MIWEDVLNRILRQLREDREAGRAHGVEHYQARVPAAFRERIAEELRALDEDGAASDRGALPETIGPFRVVGELGRGGQGRVFLAHDPQLGRDVAVKLLTGLGPITPALVQRFLREAEAASRVDHPGICAVYRTGTEGGVPWIAMRRVEGPTLAEEIERRRRSGEPLGERASLVRTVRSMELVLRALHAAHEEGVVHRDVKPGNVVLEPSGQPVVLDFGLAGLEEEDGTRLTRTGDLLGTPAYMAPEQLADEVRPVDRRTDVYAAAVTLYEALTLSPPFRAPTRAGLLRAIETREPPDPRRLNPAIPDDLATVLAKALQKDPEQRYTTALQFAEDLRRVRSFEPIVARPVGALGRLARWSRRNPALAAATAGLALAVTAGLVASSVLALQRGRALAAARTQGRLASERLARVLRLSDLKRCEELIEEEEGLWPAVPERAAAMEAWLAEARDLVGRIELHRNDLELLRELASPDGADEARRGSSADRLAGELEEAREHLALHERGEPCLELVGSTAPWDAHVASLQRRRDEILDALDAARTYAFDDPVLHWRHDRLQELIRRLESLSEPDLHAPTIRAVSERLRAARSLRERSHERHRGEWSAAIAAIGDRRAAPRYGGLEIEPQLGLVPLGEDPGSGLWEFWHVPTGERPARDESGRIVLDEASGLVLVLIPGGTFLMGSQSADPSGLRYAPEAAADEAPVHEVTLGPFFLSKYELTQAQWLRATGSNPSHYRPERLGLRFLTLLHPVENVSWTDARRVLAHLGLELPTEAQWEYAARAGSDTRYWWGGQPDPTAVNFADRSLAAAGFTSPHVDRELDDGFPFHAPVDTLQPNPFGLHHTAGNVEEWCLDRHGLYELPVRPGTGERIVFHDRSRILRGGSFNNSPSFVGSSCREAAPADSLSPSTGLRPARALVVSGG